MKEFEELNELLNPSEASKFRERFTKNLSHLIETNKTSEYIELLTQIARTHNIQGNFEQAHDVLDQINSELSDDMPVAKARYLLERGRTFKHSSMPEKAYPLLTRAFELATKNKQIGLAVESALLAAQCSSSIEETVSWSEKALKQVANEHFPTSKHIRARLHYNLAWAFHDHENYELALQYFKMAQEEFVQAGKNHRAHSARWAWARCLRSLKKFSTALQVQRSLLADLEKQGKSDGLVYEEIAEILWALGKADLAKPYFALAAIELGKNPLIVRKDRRRLDRLRALGGMRQGLTQENMAAS